MLLARGSRKCAAEDSDSSWFRRLFVAGQGPCRLTNHLSHHCPPRVQDLGWPHQGEFQDGARNDEGDRLALSSLAAGDSRCRPAARTPSFALQSGHPRRPEQLWKASDIAGTTLGLGHRKKVSTSLSHGCTQIFPAMIPLAFCLRGACICQRVASCFEETLTHASWRDSKALGRKVACEDRAGRALMSAPLPGRGWC